MLRKNYTFYESNKYPHTARLAEILCKRTGMSGVFFANGGGEANEGMIKLARKYSFDRYGTGRATIITLNNSFHGRTITTLTATGQEVFHNYFFPFTEGFRYADVNSLESLEAAAGDDVCAVMLELVQGEGGVLPLEPAYVQAVKKLCEERDWLLLVDEVQTGVDRTGKLFAFQNDGILPDVASFAKGIAGGLPMSGIMANEKCRNVLGPGTHATTFGANPVCAAADHYKGGAGSGAGNHEEGIGELLTRQVSFLRFSKRVRGKFCEHAFYPPSAGDAAGQSRKKRKILRSLKRNRVETRHII